MSASQPPRKPGDESRTGGSYPREPLGLLGVAFTSGLTLLAGLAVGYYGGRWLDGVAGTAPWLTLVGTIMGIVAGFRVLLKDILRQAPSEPTTAPARDGHDTSDGRDQEERKPDRG